MKYHDILGVMISADEQEIIKAYNDKIMALDADLSKKYPKTYERKVKELDNARQDCLEYINKPYLDKVKSELGDCIKTHTDPNRVNSDCCCYDCCGCVCIVIGIAGAISGIACCVSTAKSANERYWRAQLEEVNNDIRDLERKQTEMRPKYNEAQDTNNKLGPRIKRAAETHAKLQGEYEVFRKKMEVLNGFLSQYDCGFNLYDIIAHDAYSNKANLANRELKNLESEMASANKTIDEFSRLDSKHRELEAQRAEIQSHLR